MLIVKAASLEGGRKASKVHWLTNPDSDSPDNGTAGPQWQSLIDKDQNLIWITPGAEGVMLQIVLEPQPAVFVISWGKCKKDHPRSPNEEGANKTEKPTQEEGLLLRVQLLWLWCEMIRNMKEILML